MREGRMRRRIVKSIIVLLLLTTAIMSADIKAGAAAMVPDIQMDGRKSDKKVVKQFIEKTYPKSYRILYIKGEKLTVKKLRKRKEKRIVYVAKWISFSRGRKGITRDRKRIRYNKKVKKGERVVSYFIYNPFTKKPDDVAAVVDNGRLR